MNTNKKLPSIPKFKNYEEEANFWDTHSFADYLHIFKPAKVKFAKNLSSGITIRFDEPTLHKIRQKAHAKGVGPTTLARMWIIEKLQEQSQPASQ